jgi:CRISPR-associated protein Csm4
LKRAYFLLDRRDELKLYEITIQPLGGLGTPLKGDTLFGHFCWQVVYDPDLLEGGIERLATQYAERPLIIFSSAFPKLKHPSVRYALKRPDLPLSSLFPQRDKELKELFRSRKENKKKQWFLSGEDLALELGNADYLTDKELLEKLEGGLSRETRRHMKRIGNTQGKNKALLSFLQPHNSINRLTNCTGSEPFAPYSHQVIYYFPEMELAVFVLLEEQATNVEKVCGALERIGRWGYGKDASIGQGRFKLTGYRELPLPERKDANAVYCLAPSVPEKGSFQEAYFVPFVRFGKHGDMLARAANPFKNPVIMADEGAVFIPKDSTYFNKPYWGSAVTGLSKAMPSTIMQGYSIYLPLRVEM